MSLATKLVTLRKEKGLTQMELAERLNVSRQAVSRWEVGTAIPSIENLRVLSELYNLPVDYLLDDSAVSYQEVTDDKIHYSVNLVTSIEKRNQHILLLIIVALLLALTFAISYKIVPHPDNREPVPLSQMAEDTNNSDYTTYTFSLE